MKEILGLKFGRLVVLSQRRKKSGTQVRSFTLARCDCGIVKEYLSDNLKKGSTRSCGCYREEKSKSVESRLKSTTHGMCGTQIYNTWNRMTQRCSNSKNINFKNYGARGVTVCKRWLIFRNFYEDMGDKPDNLELDRINNNKGYYKENCRWTTDRKNSQNTRRSKYWYLFGKRYNSSPEASEFLGVHHRTIQAWCDGKSVVQNGVQNNYSPKPGCYSELKYK